MNTLTIEFPDLPPDELYALIQTVNRCVREDDFPPGAEQMDGSFRFETPHGPAFVNADTAD